MPGYEESAKPSLIERYRRHGIELQPDLVIIAEGLNDMRSGMAIQDYMADLAQVVTDIRQETGALVVLVGIYHQVFGRGANDPVALPTWTRWTPDVADVYNQAVRRVAESRALFVDAQAVMGGADWTLNPDCCHPNDLGHVLIGNAVFQAIATHCHGLGDKTRPRSISMQSPRRTRAAPISTMKSGRCGRRRPPVSSFEHSHKGGGKKFYKGVIGRWISEAACWPC